MSAKDIFHYAVKVALQKADWQITDDPLTIRLSRTLNLYIDLGAEKIIAADRNGQRIAVEVKSFLGASLISDFHTAVGQFINYRYALAEHDPERILYLAVPVETYDEFFALPFVQTVIQGSEIHLLIYDAEQEEIVAWKN
ncbi:MAG: XisH family protein [Trichocoleus desertorum ATA4-8-CV12]|jgi:hypothetical protein|nr:XisH family protein [Trichocoleus desertorum ATA4-8-CV12]